MLVVYATDVTSLITARGVELVKLKPNSVMRVVDAWMIVQGVSFALKKIDIVLLMKKRIQAILPLRIREEMVETKPAAQYFGDLRNSKLFFLELIREEILLRRKQTYGQC